MKVTEMIRKDYETWESGDNVFISAGTGSGKTYFILNVLEKYAVSKEQNILFLTHRSVLSKQVKEDYFNTKEEKLAIDFMTYQKLEELIKEGNTLDYDYYVFDEVHYLVEDSSFNINTKYSLEFLLEVSDSIKVFMSATGDMLINMFKALMKLRVYKIDKNYDNISSVRFYEEIPYEHLISDLIDENELGIIFINNHKDALKLHNKFPNETKYLCSANNRSYNKVDTGYIERVIKHKNLQGKILITTKVFETGVTIVDKDLKHIVVDDKSVMSVVQMIGRKRFINKHDKVNLHIKNINNNQLAGYKSFHKSSVDNIRLIKKLGTDYLKTYDITKTNYSFVDMKVNDEGNIDLDTNNAVYLYHMVFYQYFRYILKFGKTAYMNYLKIIFNNDKIKYINLVEKNESILNVIEKYLNIPLNDKNTREDFVQELNLRPRYKLIKSAKGINSVFREYNIPYRIEILTYKIQKDKKSTRITEWKLYKI